MNFLAHHIISIFPEDYYYNLGLTFPDILSLQNRKCKIVEKNVDEKILFFNNDNKLYSLFLGMKIHLIMDKWFHNSRHFFNLMKMASEAVSISNFPVHQFIEILFDIFLDNKDKDFAKSLMNIYKDERLDIVLKKINNIYEINEENFLKLRNYISSGLFYENYLDNDKLMVLLQKLAIKSKRKEFYINVEDSKSIIDRTMNLLHDYFENLYIDLLDFSRKKQNELNKKEYIIE